MICKLVEYIYQKNAEVIYTRNKTGGTTVKIKIKTASERHE